jgi:hypothetical protein
LVGPHAHPTETAQWSDQGSEKTGRTRKRAPALNKMIKQNVDL